MLSGVGQLQTNFRVRSFSGLDLLTVLLSFVSCHYFYLGGLSFSPERLGIVVATLVSSYSCLTLAGLYQADRNFHWHKQATLISIVWVAVVLVVSMLAFLTKIAVDVSRAWFAFSMVSSYTLLLLIRLASGLFYSHVLKRGVASHSLVVIGKTELIAGMQEQLASDALNSYKVIKAIALGDDLVGNRLATELQEQKITELTSFIESQRKLLNPVAKVCIALPLADEALIKKIVECLRNTSVDVCFAPDNFGKQLMMGSVESISDIPVINLSDIRLRGAAEAFKSVFDRSVSLVTLILISPVLLVIAALVKYGSPGPVFFKQQRYGIDGAVFEVWKFRTMQPSSVGGEVVQATRNDARVTKLGKYLRKYSLDELPQFINVLKGDMSIVGPRPHAVEHNEEYRVKIDGYMLRHRIKPGITGWAQVNGWRGETDTLEKMEGRVRFDLDYIGNWSAWLDLKIILMTIFGVFSNKDVY